MFAAAGTGMIHLLPSLLLLWGFFRVSPIQGSGGTWKMRRDVGLHGGQYIVGVRCKHARCQAVAGEERYNIVPQLGHAREEILLGLVALLFRH